MATLLSTTINGTGTATSDLRAPIFYDSANTGYYLDPNAGSYLYGLQLSGNTYFRPNSWVQLDGNYGMYWPNHYGLHIYPNNDGSYGSLQVKGSKNSWHGIHFDSGNTLMSNANEAGFHQQGVGWKYRWYQGTLRVSRGDQGGGTEYTVIDGGNIGDQSVNYAASAGAVAWGNVSGRPSALSSFSNDLGNYGGWITSSGRAYPRRSDGADINFYWDGQGGQPTWLWGSNDGQNFYVWNPSNFSVNYAASAGAVAWDGISGKPSVATHRGEGTNYIDYSRYVYNNGAYSGTGWIEPSDLGVRYANTAGSAPANGGQSDRVTINYNNDSNSTYQMLWGSGNTVYGTQLIYCNPNSETLYARSFRGSDNVAGTGEATHHPSGIYSQGNNWLYGPLYINGNSMYDLNLAYISTIYDRDNNGWYMNPGELSNMNIIFIDRIDNYGYITNSTWNTAGMFYVGEAGDAGAYPIQCNAVRWDLSIYSPNGPIWGRGIVDISDLRKKTNINDLESPLEKVKALRGVTYEWLDGRDTKTHSGFIAQEVEPVLPGVITTTVDPDTLGEVKGIAYSEIIPYLVESIKAQQIVIEDLQARLASLENNS